MRDKRVIGSFLAFLSLLGSVPPVDGDPIALTLHDRDKAVPTAVAQSAQQPNEKAVVDRLFKKILDQGFLVTLTTLDELKTQAELQEPGQFLLKVEVKLKASEAVQQALEATARELGGLSLDAVLEVDYGMISWQARAFRVSTDPQILEYFQRRVASLVFVLELGLDDGGVYE
ncbi:MAG: hypothetical protein HY581_07240, partial [Nitrospirae bacterium]|nr:hypothetical protein [Nitrospirota bacterium]